MGKLWNVTKKTPGHAVFKQRLDIPEIGVMNSSEHTDQYMRNSNPHLLGIVISLNICTDSYLVNGNVATFNRCRGTASTYLREGLHQWKQPNISKTDSVTRQSQL
jgi:hypothetical protein